MSETTTTPRHTAVICKGLASALFVALVLLAATVVFLGAFDVVVLKIVANH